MKKVLLLSLILLMALSLSACGVQTQNNSTPTTPTVNEPTVSTPVVNTPAINAPIVNTPAPTNVTATVTVPPVTAPKPIVAQAKTITINIQNFAFNPATVTIKAGDTINWTNNDSAPHQIKSDSFNSSTLSNGDSFQYKFTATGTYNYSCAIHPSMQGQIIVE